MFHGDMLPGQREGSTTTTFLRYEKKHTNYIILLTRIIYIIITI